MTKRGFSQFNLPRQDVQYNPIDQSGGAGVLSGAMQSRNYSREKSGFSIDGDLGNAEFNDLRIRRNIIIGSSIITISSGDSIQTALDQLNTAGGGTLNLRAGTYTQTTALTIYSGISIIGEGSSSTTINFNSTSANLSLTGTNVYTTGTVSINTGSTSLTGSGTTFTSAMVGRQIFLSNRWYVISAFGSTTSLTLATAFIDTTLSGSTYRISNVIKNVFIEGLTLSSSTGTGIVGTDVRDIFLDDLIFSGNNKGFSFTNFMSINPDTVTCSAHTSNGYELTNGSSFNCIQLSSVSNTGSGAVINNIKSSSFQFSANNANTVDGFNLTSTSSSVFKVEASGNGGQGFELVSGNDSVFIDDALVTGNTSDGIKLTATSDNCIIGGAVNLTGNGGYGVNIAASSCDNTRIGLCLFASNTSGAVNDSGTGTVIRGNIGINDNSTSSIVGDPFGGTGANGPLSISSGTTNIDAAGAAYVVKNYTSISVTGTGSVVLINPNTKGTMLVIKSQGDVTLTTSGIAFSVAGSGGAGGVAKSGAGDGNIGSVGVGNIHKQGAGGGGTAGGGAGGTSDTINLISNANSVILAPGAGGGGGRNDGGTGKAGGNGGGALVIECAGSYNFTTGSISVAGSNGENGTTNKGAGGGGGGGTIFVMYRTLVADSGTYVVSGGSGGSAGSGTDSESGGGGASLKNNGTAGGGTGVAGGAGGTGESIRFDV